MNQLGVNAFWLAMSLGVAAFGLVQLVLALWERRSK